MATLDRLAPPVAALPREGTWTPRRAIATAVTTAVAIALLQVFQSGTFANTGATIQQLEAARTDARARVHDLEAEIAALASLDRTERAARERLGMVRATNITYIEVGVPAPAGPLLPRPVTDATRPTEDNRAWWEKILQALPLR
ncbi:MAG TPA: septum formation initiator family protein [Dehalococcoidia bacterium]|nr:septum formation initiator family protein [Dehalococcoidia bacterium]